MINNWSSAAPKGTKERNLYLCINIHTYLFIRMFACHWEFGKVVRDLHNWKCCNSLIRIQPPVCWQFFTGFFRNTKGNCQWLFFFKFSLCFSQMVSWKAWQSRCWKETHKHWTSWLIPCSWKWSTTRDIFSFLPWSKWHQSLPCNRRVWRLLYWRTTVLFSEWSDWLLHSLVLFAKGWTPKVSCPTSRTSSCQKKSDSQVYLQQSTRYWWT